MTLVVSNISLKPWRRLSRDTLTFLHYDFLHIDLHFLDTVGIVTLTTNIIKLVQASCRLMIKLENGSDIKIASTRLKEVGLPAVARFHAMGAES